MTEQTKAIFENPQLLRQKLGKFLDTKDSVKIEEFAVISEKCFIKGNKIKLSFVISWSWWALFLGILPLIWRKNYLQAFIWLLLFLFFIPCLVFPFFYKYLIIKRFEKALDGGNEQFIKMSGVNLIAVILVIFLPIVLIIFGSIVTLMFAGTRNDAEISSTLANMRTLSSDAGAYYAVKETFKDTKYSSITNVVLDDNNKFVSEKAYLMVDGQKCIGIKLNDDYLEFSKEHSNNSVCEEVQKTKAIQDFFKKIEFAPQKEQSNTVQSDFELAKKAYEQKDYKKAFELYKKSCDNMDFAGCYWSGLLYYTGEGVEKDYNTANNFFEKACNGGYVKSCHVLASNYYRGEGVNKDIKMAISLFEKACNSDNMVSCNMLGISYHNGEGVKQSYKKAFDLWKKVCENSNGAVASIACYNLATLYNNGTGVRINENLAREYFGKACDLGEEKGCEAYRDMK